MAQNMGELLGRRGQDTFDSSGDSYGTPQNGHRVLSNVQQNPGEPDVMPAYSGNLGRKAAMFGNFRNATPGTGGTFFPQDAEPKEMPHSITAAESSDYTRAA